MSRYNRNGLTEGQQAFCDAYRTDPERCAWKAYMVAFPNCKKQKAAEAAASRLLANERVKMFLNYKTEVATEAADIEQERILRELAAVGFSDLGDIYQVDGTLKAIHEIPEHARRAISSVKVKRSTDKDGNETVEYEYKLWSKTDSLRMLGQTRKMFTDRTEHTAPEGEGAVLVVPGMMSPDEWKRNTGR